MKAFATVALAIAACITQGAAQISIANNGTIVCSGPAANQNFCAGNSLTSNIIIRCSKGIGYGGNCNDNLAGIPPVGVKSAALCYQTSPTAGNAACSFNGIVYPDSGPSFAIPTNGTVKPTSTVTAVVVKPSGSGSPILGGSNSTKPTYATPGPSVGAVPFKGTGAQTAVMAGWVVGAFGVAIVTLGML
ncbi:hypothetical protein MMC25_007680 [Agyrium rufum]|nr:hypothetical protein [Agyrium rufum]